MENQELFFKFVEYLKQTIKEKYSIWDKDRIKYINDQKNKRKLILLELSFFNYTDPLNTIDNNYLNEKYNSNLLTNELNDIGVMLNEDSKEEILKKCEVKERILKIIDFYLTFVIEKNFDYLSKYKHIK